MLVKEGETAVREKRWADANRLWGQAVRDFPTEPRRSTVAFLRARLLLQELGDARAAAEAFAGIEAFGAPTALVEDALAREVEAWARAGVAVRARERAEAFIRRFPTSYRRSDVAAAGGLVPE
jgi:transmembrane sensor